MMQGQMPEERPRVAELPEEEKTQYYGVLGNARELIFGDMGKRLVQMISRAEDPADGIGQASAMIVQLLETGARKEGVTLPEEIVNLVAAEIVTDIADLAHAAKVISPADQKEASQIAGKAFLDTARHYVGAQARGGQEEAPEGGDPMMEG